MFNAHFQKDLGDPGTVDGPPCSMVTCSLQTRGTYCRGDGDPIYHSGPCFNGAYPFRKWAVTYNQCVAIGASWEWALAGATYTTVPSCP